MRYTKMHFHHTPGQEHEHPHCHQHEHEHAHSHQHVHEDGTVHDHEHVHAHVHEHEHVREDDNAHDHAQDLEHAHMHTHGHDHAHNGSAARTMDQTIQLLEYLCHHNEEHAQELASYREGVENDEAETLIAESVELLNQSNAKLASALAVLKGSN